MRDEHIETRSATMRAAANDYGAMRIKGTAIRWGDVAHIDDGFIEEFAPDGFTEEFAPGAFTQSLATTTTTRDVRLLASHNWELPLARQNNRTLIIRETEEGLELIAELNPANSMARDIYARIVRGDMTDMSVGAVIQDDEIDWTDPNTPHRIVRRADLQEVSIVAVSAYPLTNVTPLPH